MRLLLLASGALDPSREQAREWAVRELAKPEYQEARPNLFERAVDWIYEHLTRIQGPSGPAGNVGLIIGVAVFVVVAIWAIHRSGGLSRNARTKTGAALEDRARTAAEHYGAADTAAAQGDWSTAVVERFRGMVRELEERTILTAQRGRTADEIAAQAADVVPALGPRFAAAARIFDDVHYGGRDAGQAQDDALRALAGELRSVRPATLPARSVPVPSGSSR